MRVTWSERTNINQWAHKFCLVTNDHLWTRNVTLFCPSFPFPQHNTARGLGNYQIKKIIIISTKQTERAKVNGGHSSDKNWEFCCVLGTCRALKFSLVADIDESEVIIFFFVIGRCCPALLLLKKQVKTIHCLKKLCWKQNELVYKKQGATKAHK